MTPLHGFRSLPHLEQDPARTEGEGPGAPAWFAPKSWGNNQSFLFGVRTKLLITNRTLTSRVAVHHRRAVGPIAITIAAVAVFLFVLLVPIFPMGQSTPCGVSCPQCFCPFELLYPLHGSISYALVHHGVVVVSEPNGPLVRFV